MVDAWLASPKPLEEPPLAVGSLASKLPEELPLLDASLASTATPEPPEESPLRFPESAWLVLAPEPPSVADAGDFPPHAKSAVTKDSEHEPRPQSRHMIRE